MNYSRSSGGALQVNHSSEEERKYEYNRLSKELLLLTSDILSRMTQEDQRFVGDSERLVSIVNRLKAAS